MGLRLEDRWIWDFWTARADGRYHAFYLQAPRALGDPNLRHAHASVGHAVSEDLCRWTVLDDAIGPGEPGSWDALAIWTGSIVRHEGVWHMFYTGASLLNGVVSQRIGVAVSDDLMGWEKRPGPLFSADARWYETIEEHDWYEEAWRDPWVFKGPDGMFHALVTARVNEGPPDGRGVIGHALSPDLAKWEVAPPLTGSGEFGHLEVSQLVPVNKRYVLVFSCQGNLVSAARRARLQTRPSDATYVLDVSSPLGPYDISRASPALLPDLYSGRLIEKYDGTKVWLAFRNLNGHGTFLGELSDPIPWASHPETR